MMVRCMYVCMSNIYPFITVGSSRVFVNNPNLFIYCCCSIHTHIELTPENYGAKMMINKMMLLLRNAASRVKVFKKLVNVL